MINNIIKNSVKYFYRKISNSREGIKIPILCYHSVNNKYNIDADPIDLDLFERHLYFIKKKYNVIKLKDSVEMILNNKSYDKNILSITFDDGYIDNFINVFPLIKKYKLPITIFIVTDFINQKISLIDNKEWNAMTWDNVKEMNKSGLVDIEAHSLTHKNLITLKKTDAYHEIAESREQIKKYINYSPIFFAYPNGQRIHYSSRDIQLVKEAGYSAAFSTLWNTMHNSNRRWEIPRIIIKSDDTLDKLQNKIDGDYDFLYNWHLAKKYFSPLYK